MMGQHGRSESLFYYFRLEDQVPETHLLRLIEKHVSFAFVREKLKATERKYRRFNLQHPVRLNSADSIVEFDAVSRKIGMGGVLLETGFMIPHNSPASLIVTVLALRWFARLGS